MELAVWTQDAKKEPGDFGDPVGLGMYDVDMRNKELNNGRIAMFSALGIISADLLTGKDGIQQLGMGALGRAVAQNEPIAFAGASAAAPLKMAAVARNASATASTAATDTATKDAAGKDAPPPPPPPFDPSKQVGALPPLGFFDPLNFSKVGDKEGFRNLRAAEIKHGRVAMMAALGAVAQHYIKFPGFEKVPAGLGAVTTAPGTYGFAALFVLSGVLELAVWTQDAKKEPGDFGDPVGLGMYDVDMRNKELNNGRIAMFSALGIISADLLTGKDGIQQLGMGALGRAVAQNEPIAFAGASAAAPLKIAASSGRTSLRAGAQGKPVAVPFLPEPGYRKTNGGPGFGDPFLREADAGFDPLNYALGKGLFDAGPKAVPGTAYYNFRESEIKHCRFAMLASLGIFFERGRYETLEQLGLETNSNLSTEEIDALPGVPTWFFPAIIGIQFLAEYYNQQNETDGDFLSVEYKKDRCPGDLNFDPLNLKGLSAAFGKDLIHLHNAELKHGRIAMVAVTIYLFRELVLEGETFG